MPIAEIDDNEILDRLPLNLRLQWALKVPAGVDLERARQRTLAPQGSFFVTL